MTTNRNFGLRALAAFAAAGGSTLAAAGGLTFVGPVPYLSVADSPIASGASLLVQDFEAATIQTPGAVLASPELMAPAPTTDSVDGDDGAIDGSGSAGWPVIQPAGSTMAVLFLEEELGAFPTRFGLVVTDTAAGPQTFRLSVFDPAGDLLGSHDFVVEGDGADDGATAEDRFIGVTGIGAFGRVEITALDAQGEYDHVQFEEPEVVRLAQVGPQAYLSVADSPFDIDANPVGFEVIDAEQGVVAGFGASVEVSLLIGPAFYTDSVDGDDGVIDGSGAEGHSMAQLAGSAMVVSFDAALLGGLPTSFGVVVTDGCSGPQTFQLAVFGEGDAPLGTLEYVVTFDDTLFGTTDEDRFIGFTSPVGVSRVELLGPGDCNFELDHIQYDVPVPNLLTAIAPVAYLSIEDSPFGVAQDPGAFVVVDVEGGAIDAFGATIEGAIVIAPAFYTDSVDGDDGAIDGSGAEGHSLAQLVGTPTVVTFDAKALEGLPTSFGVVITDSCSGAWTFELRAFDEMDQPLGLVQQVVVLDETQFGTTAEDRFIGFTSPVGVARVEMYGPDVCNFEFDHLQYNRPAPAGAPEDLNGDGVVDGADLGILLAAWGTVGPGDFNRDGTVDGADLGILLAAFGGG